MSQSLQISIVGAHLEIRHIARAKTRLDFFWLKDKSLADLDNLPEPDDIAAEIIDNVDAGFGLFSRNCWGVGLNFYPS